MTFETQAVKRARLGLDAANIKLREAAAERKAAEARKAEAEALMRKHFPAPTAFSAYADHLRRHDERVYQELGMPLPTKHGEINGHHTEPSDHR